MKIFEFYFNPREKKNRIFKTFSSEKQKGLYLVGELGNIIPQNARLLQRLFLLLEKEYGLSPLSQGKDRMKHALSKGNEFLAKESKKGNTDWLGNIHCVALFFATPRKGLPEIFFATIGTMNIWLGREKRIVDIEKTLGKTLQPHHVKAFGNVISGKLLPGDKLFIATKELSLALQKEGLLKGSLAAQDESQLKALFTSKQPQLKKVQGVLFSAFLERGKRQNKLSLLTLPDLPELPRLPIKMDREKAIFSVFILLLLGGMIFLRGGSLFSDKETQVAKETIAALRQEADAATAGNDEREAFVLLTKALDLASSKEIRPVQKEIEEKLLTLAHIEKIDNPQAVADIPAKEIGLIPQHMVLAGNILYLSNPSSENIYAIDIRTNEKTLLQKSANIKLGASLPQSGVFFEEPDTLLEITGATEQEKTLQSPYPNFHPTSMATFEGSAYFWDSQARQIVKYPLTQSSALSAHLWLNPQTKQRPETKNSNVPFAIDRNIWIVSKENKIERYFSGFYQETLSQLVFPKIQEISELYTRPDLSSLYILEASQKRVVLISKSGLVQKQYESPHFDNLLALQVSPDGKTIYLLNGTRVFKIEQ
ncbi:MAG: hypothetical protein Q7S63_00620 [bacterium]|nr:hypothetical protein [bacterium]